MRAVRDGKSKKYALKKCHANKRHDTQRPKTARTESGLDRKPQGRKEPKDRKWQGQKAARTESGKDRSGKDRKRQGEIAARTESETCLSGNNQEV